MVASEIRVRIFPDTAFGLPAHRIRMKVRSESREFSRTQIVPEDHLRSLFDRIFDAMKEELKEDILKSAA